MSYPKIPGNCGKCSVACELELQCPKCGRNRQQDDTNKKLICCGEYAWCNRCLTGSGSSDLESLMNNLTVSIGDHGSDHVGSHPHQQYIYSSTDGAASSSSFPEPSQQQPFIVRYIGRPRKRQVIPASTTQLPRTTIRCACSNCGIYGHEWTACPDIICASCENFGHISFYCPKLICDGCKGTGHTSFHCPNRIDCGICHSAEHKTRDCPNMICERCKRSGHMDLDCKGCINCGDRKHFFTDCPTLNLAEMNYPQVESSSDEDRLGDSFVISDDEDDI